MLALTLGRFGGLAGGLAHRFFRCASRAPLADRVTICRRGAEAIHSNELQGGPSGGQNFPGFRRTTPVIGLRLALLRDKQFHRLLHQRQHG